MGATKGEMRKQRGKQWGLVSGHTNQLRTRRDKINSRLVNGKDFFTNGRLGDVCSQFAGGEGWV